MRTLGGILLGIGILGIYVLLTGGYATVAEFVIAIVFILVGFKLYNLPKPEKQKPSGASDGGCDGRIHHDASRSYYNKDGELTFVDDGTHYFDIDGNLHGPDGDIIDVDSDGAYSPYWDR